MEVRRIVGIGHMAKQLIYPGCGTDLKLRNLTKETPGGLGSYLYIPLCDNTESSALGQNHHWHDEGESV